jgi:hypothetical protein
MQANLFDSGCGGSEKNENILILNITLSNFTLVQMGQLEVWPQSKQAKQNYLNK